MSAESVKQHCETLDATGSGIAGSLITYEYVYSDYYELVHVRQGFQGLNSAAAVAPIIADGIVFSAIDTDRAVGHYESLQLALHIVPFGTLADDATDQCGGICGETILWTLADATIFVPYIAAGAKATGATRTACTVKYVGLATEVTASTYQGYQAYQEIEKGNVTGGQIGLQLALGQIVLSVRGTVKADGVVANDWKTFKDDFFTGVPQVKRALTGLLTCDAYTKSRVADSLFDTVRGRTLSDLSNHEVGEIGESIAKCFLEENGYVNIVSIQNRSGHELTSSLKLQTDDFQCLKSSRHVLGQSATCHHVKQIWTSFLRTF